LVPEIYERLEVLGARLAAGLRKSLLDTGVSGCVQRVGSMITLFFHPGPVRSYADAAASDRDRFAAWHRGLLCRGVYWPASQFEAAFISAAHTEDEVDRTVEVAREALQSSAQ
jgi:glutamate-1-semialdehyde 2,1-aminomutase